MLITSTNNEKIKFIKKLMEDKRYLFLDSPKLIEEAVNAKIKIKYFITTENKEDKFNKIFEYMNKCGAEKIEVSDRVFKTLSVTVWSQGIIGIALKNERTLAPPENNYLVLDEVQDPGNVGTLIRSGLGSGFEDIYLLNCASLSNDKVIRSTMGAIFRARIYELTREDFLKIYPSFKNKNLIVADMKGENLYTTKIATPCGVVIGNEGNGVSKDIRQIATKTIAIPMKNELESLNASVAGSIIMFKIFNQ